MRKATLFVLVLLAANVMAQTTNITSLATVAVATLTAPDGSPGIFEVARYSPDCSATGCTEMLYSFCLDQIPGCREGFGSVPQSSFAGTVTTNYLRHDKLTFQYEAVASDSTFFTNFVCNAFDQYGDCLDETEVPGDAGLIQLAFTKTSVWADLNNSVEKEIVNGLSRQTATGIDDASSANVSGSVLGAMPVQGMLELYVVYYSRVARPVLSLQLKSHLTDAARRRLEMLELKIMKP